MSAMRSALLGLLALALSACGAEVSEPAAVSSERAKIEPHQFALVPCRSGLNSGLPPCVLLAAGGKYFLMGAPEGALTALTDEEVRLLDGVLLFSLLPQHVDGLDTVRHVTWKKGRAQRLLVGGPEGTKDFARALDSAFEVPDAEYFARESPSGGFDASLLRSIDVIFGTSAGTEVVDTGDLQIRGFHAPSGHIVYLAEYGERRAAIGMCGGAEDVALLSDIAAGDHITDCNDQKEISFIIE